MLVKCFSRLECPNSYATDYDKIFRFGPGLSSERLQLPHFTPSLAKARMLSAGHDVLRFRHWSIAGEATVASTVDTVTELWRWQHYIGKQLGFHEQASWRKPKCIGTSVAVRKKKYTDPIVPEKLHKMRPIENIGRSGWRTAERGAAVAWNMLIANHTGPHFALCNISKFVPVAMEKQAKLRRTYGQNLGLLEVTTDIADFFVMMPWARVINGARRIF